MTSRRTSRRTRGPVAAATVLAVAALSGCGTSTDTASSGDDQVADDRQGGDGRSAATPTPDPSRRGTGSRSHTTAEENTVQIEIRVGGERFAATLDDTPAGRDLLAQLPQTIRMSDHGDVEKTGPLAEPLSLDGQPDGADPDVGDLGYYSPGNDLVLYYGDQSYYSGIVILGRLDRTAAPRLAAMTGDITVTVTTSDAS